MKLFLNSSKRFYHPLHHQHGKSCQRHQHRLSNGTDGSFWKVKIKVETSSMVRRLISYDQDFRVLLLSTFDKGLVQANQVLSTFPSELPKPHVADDDTNREIGEPKSFRAIMQKLEESDGVSDERTSEFRRQPQFISILKSTYRGCSHHPILVHKTRRIFRIMQDVNVTSAVEMKANFPKLDLVLYDNREIKTERKAILLRQANFDWIKALEDALQQQGKNYSKPVSATAKVKGDMDTYEDNENLKTFVLEYFRKLSLEKSLSLAFKGYETGQLIRVLGLFTSLQPSAQGRTWQPVVDAILQEVVLSRFDHLETISLTQSEFDQCMKGATLWSAEQNLLSEFHKVSRMLGKQAQKNF